MIEPPSAEVAEQTLLGHLLKDGRMFIEVSDFLLSSHFFYEDNRQIYAAMEKISEVSGNIDITNIISKLEHVNLAYLADLAHNAHGAFHLKDYAQTIRDKAKEREILMMCNEMEKIIYEDSIRSSQERISDALSLPMRFDTTSEAERSTELILAQVIADIKGRNEQRGLKGLPTGFAHLDKRLSGLQKTDLVILAARPAMGKTTLAANILYNILKSSEQGICLMFSLEMSADQIINKMISSGGGIESNHLRDGNMSDEDWTKLNKITALIHKLPLVIDDRGGLTIQQLRAKALREKRKHGQINLIVVDYLTLLRDPTKQNNRTEEVGSISRSLKALAKELCCPVLALAQLSRKVEERANNRPRLSDLRDSGEIEQDADIVMFLYRDVVYNEGTDNPEVAELHTAKFRGGEIGVDSLMTDLARSTFTDMSADFKRIETKTKGFYNENSRV